MIVIVDYGMGNLRSVQKALERVGCAAQVSDKPEAVAAADRLVVPGVGAFGDAMTALRQRGLVDPIRDFSRRGRPLLGICLGLQVFFDESEEMPRGCAATPPAGASAGAGLEKGLGLVPGRVVKFGPQVVEQGFKVPHMGWNAVEPVGGSSLFEGLVPPAGSRGVYFYFAHSYYAVPRREDVVAGRTDYGGRFTSAITAGNIYATQFHPEKSQAAGLALLKNFVTRT